MAGAHRRHRAGRRAVLEWVMGLCVLIPLGVSLGLLVAYLATRQTP